MTSRSKSVQAFLSVLSVLVTAAAPPALAQTTPCDAVFDPALGEGLSAVRARVRLEWRDLDAVWVTRYRLSGEKANPFDPERLATARKGPAAAATPSAAAAPPIEGFASARDVRCNASSAHASDAVRVVFTATALRFKEGKGSWSAVVREAPIASYVLMRSRSGWTVIDRTSEDAVLPPDARRDLPPESLARRMAAEPWAGSQRPSREKPSKTRHVKRA